MPLYRIGMVQRELPKGKICWVCEKDDLRTLFHCTVDMKSAFIHKQCWIDVTPKDLHYLLPKGLFDKL